MRNWLIFTIAAAAVIFSFARWGGYIVAFFLHALFFISGYRTPS